MVIVDRAFSVYITRVPEELEELRAHEEPQDPKDLLSLENL